MTLELPAVLAVAGLCLISAGGVWYATRPRGAAPIVQKPPSSPVAPSLDVAGLDAFTAAVERARASVEALRATLGEKPANG